MTIHATIIDNVIRATFSGGVNITGDFSALDEMLDMTTSQTTSANATLSRSRLNTLVVLGNGAANYTVTLPSMTPGEFALIKLVCPRNCTKVVTVQSASGTIDNQSVADFIAGESATAWYDGTEWQLLDHRRIPFVAEMLITATSTPGIGAFSDLPYTTAGDQMMQADLKALWSYSGGYFTAPRVGIYRIDATVPVTPDVAGLVYFGAYNAASGGSAPSNTGGDFDVFPVTATLQSLKFSRTFGMSKNGKLFTSIRPNAPIATLTVAAPATLAGTVTVTEIFR